MSTPGKAIERLSQRYQGLRRITRRDTWILILIGVTGLVILWGWLFPRVIALYYLSDGSRMLDRAIREEGFPIPPDFACNVGSIQDPAAVEALSQATGFLHQVLSYRPGEPQAHLLLGRAYCLAGEPDRAVRSFQQYVALHPENPLGRIELGFAYASGGQITSALPLWRELDINPDHFIRAAQSARMAGHSNSAAAWYRYATFLLGYDLDTFTGWPGPAPVSFESFYSTRNWQPYKANSPGVFETSQGVLRMQYHNIPDQRDIFSFTSYLHMGIGSQKELHLRLRGSGETFFTLETVIDGKRNRPVAYRPVDTEWAIWSYPLDGELLTEITISTGEEKQPLSPPQYELWIDWLALQ